MTALAASPAQSRPRRVRVLSIQTTLLGNTTYGELLRRSFRDSQRIDFAAEWEPPQREIRVPGMKHLLFERPPVDALRARNIDFYPTRYELGTSLLAGRLAARRAQSADAPDVLHFHTQCLALTSIPLMRRIPTVVSLDMTARQTARQVTPAAWRWTHAPSSVLEGAALRAAAAVVTFSRWAADAVADEHGIDPQRIHVIPPGVDRAAFDEVLALRARIDRSGPKRLLFVGGEFERKGGWDLLAVFRERFSGQDVVLDLVTRETAIPPHPQITVHHGVAAFSPAWQELYARADVLVLPTRRDASPHAFVEALAAGIPAIGTAVGSIGETLVDGENGYIVPPGDPVALAERIQRLVNDAALRERFGAAGRARVATMYDATRNAAALEDVFAAVAPAR